MSSKNPKIVATLLTISVVVLLILAGPVSAFDVAMNAFSDTTPTKGDTITTTATITINTAESSIEENLVRLYMDDTLVCSGNVSASSLTCNSGYTVSQTADTTSAGYGYSYGYGYGYGYWSGSTNGVLTYSISVDTTNLGIGSHTVNLTLDEGENRPSATRTITVQASSSGGGSTTHDATETDLEEGYSKTLYRGDKVDFNLGGDSHELRVMSISNKQVSIAIQSDPQYATIAEGGSERFDLDGDGKDDLLVSVFEVTPYSADIKISAIEDIVLVVEEPETQSEQSFDIDMALEQATVGSLDDLTAVINFGSFGSNVPVILSFVILNEGGAQVYAEDDSVVVNGELVYSKSFDAELEPGKYTLVLITHSGDVASEFKSDFEIREFVGAGITGAVIGGAGSLWAVVGLILFVAIAWIILRMRKKK